MAGTTYVTQTVAGPRAALRVRCLTVSPVSSEFPWAFCFFHSLDKASDERVCACSFSLREAAKATTFFANTQAALQLRQ